MFRYTIPKGTTDVSVEFHVMDSTDGTDETGYAFNTAGVDFWYRREGGSVTAITEATQTAGGAHSDGGLVHLSDGVGRLDLPDAACAIGSDGATHVTYGGFFTGMLVTGGVIQLTDPVNEIFQSEVVGATGNDTTHAHVPNWTYGDDEILDYVIAIKDVSEDEWHFRIVNDWVNSTKLVGWAGALPASVQASTDLVCLLGYLGDGTNLTEAGGTGDHLTAIDVASISGSTAAADNLEEFAESIITGTAQTGTLSTTQATTDLTGYADDELNGRTIIFKSGTANGQSARITDYANASGLVSFTTITTAPANGDLFIIL